MKYSFSQHALQQMMFREITKEIVDGLLSGPDQIVEQDDLMVFQGIIKDFQEQRFLIRVFVNVGKNPPLIVTVYKTSISSN